MHTLLKPGTCQDPVTGRLGIILPRWTKGWGKKDLSEKRAGREMHGLLFTWKGATRTGLRSQSYRYEGKGR